MGFRIAEGYLKVHKFDCKFDWLVCEKLLLHEDGGRAINLMAAAPRTKNGLLRDRSAHNNSDSFSKSLNSTSNPRYRPTSSDTQVRPFEDLFKLCYRTKRKNAKNDLHAGSPIFAMNHNVSIPTSYSSRRHPNDNLNTSNLGEKKMPDKPVTFGFTECESLFILHSLCRIISNLHNIGIYHMDVKIDQFLVVFDDKIKCVEYRNMTKRRNNPNSNSNSNSSDTGCLDTVPDFFTERGLPFRIVGLDVGNAREKYTGDDVTEVFNNSQTKNEEDFLNDFSETNEVSSSSSSTHPPAVLSIANGPSGALFDNVNIPQNVPQVFRSRCCDAVMLSKPELIDALITYHADLFNIAQVVGECLSPVADMFARGILFNSGKSESGTVQGVKRRPLSGNEIECVKSSSKHFYCTDEFLKNRSMNCLFDARGSGCNNMLSKSGLNILYDGICQKYLLCTKI